MKKKSGNATIQRINLKSGNFDTISKNVIRNKNLTEPAKVLLILMLNNSTNWVIIFEYYKSLLEWSSNKMSAAVDNLIANGYMQKIGNPKRPSHYVISEFGNLNPSTSGDKDSNSDKLSEDITINYDLLFDVLTNIDDTEIVEKSIEEFLKYQRQKKSSETTLSEVEDLVIQVALNICYPMFEEQIGKYPKATKGQKEAILKRGEELLLSRIQKREPFTMEKFRGTILGVAAHFAKPKRELKDYED